MKTVSIITINYNQQQVTEALLRSIADTNTYAAIEIIVVDNASKTDPVPEWIKRFPAVRFIRSEKNLGFAGGNNLGIQQATGDFFFLVNNDTEFTPSLIQTLVDLLENNTGVGIVSPKIKYFDKPTMLQYAGFTPMNYFTMRNKCIGQFAIDTAQFDHLTGPTGFAHGAAMMVRKEVIAKAGLMAENFFLYYEEMDWCEKIKRSGYEVWVCMQALIYHKESVSVGKTSPLKEYFMNRNRLLFLRKNTDMIHRIVFYIYFSLIIIPRNILRYIMDGKPGYILVFMRAIWWNITHNKKSNDLGYQLK
ncbi:MAG TPA: glycosyltransferase family 2 protein [Ferruginibacter sp.]|nr:glycosyltransferase family 2 protein [Ferruginibacter sp.]